MAVKQSPFSNASRILSKIQYDCFLTADCIPEVKAIVIELITVQKRLTHMSDTIPSLVS